MSDPQQQFLLIPSAKARGFTRGARHPLAAGALCIALAVGVGHGLLWNLRRSPAPRPPARSGVAPVAPRDTLDTLPPVESGQLRPGAADSSSRASRRIAGATSRYAAPTPVPVAPPPARRPAPKPAPMPARGAAPTAAPAAPTAAPAAPAAAPAAPGPAPISPPAPSSTTTPAFTTPASPSAAPAHRAVAAEPPPPPPADSTPARASAPATDSTPASESTPALKLSPFLRSHPWAAVPGGRYYYPSNCPTTLQHPDLVFFRSQAEARAGGFEAAPADGCR